MHFVNFGSSGSDCEKERVVRTCVVRVRAFKGKGTRGTFGFPRVAELVPCGTSPCMVFGCLSGLCECLEASLGLEHRISHNLPAEEVFLLKKT